MIAAPISTNVGTTAGTSSDTNNRQARPSRCDRPVRNHSLGNGFHSSPDPFVTTWVGKIRKSDHEVLVREATVANRSVAYIIRGLVEGWVEEVERARRKREEKEKRERGRARK